jgi:hypothetical protein
VTADALPAFPAFAPLERGNAEALRAAFAAAQPAASEQSLAYQWVWRPYTGCRVAQLGESLLLLHEPVSDAGSYLLPPIAPDPQTAAACLVEAAGAGAELPTRVFRRVPEAVAEHLRDRPGLVVEEEEKRADYMHRAEDLRTLAGRRFHKKRNLIQQFEAACPHAAYRAMDDALAAACIAFSRAWLERHPGREAPGLQKEVATTCALLEDRTWLGIAGGVLLDGERILGFALGESLNRDTFVVRVEKCDTSVPGTYQLINREIARHGTAGCEWINREQDLDLPGLRRAKRSYHPHHLLRKFEVRPA